MSFKEVRFLHNMKKKFVNEGYFNNGAVSPHNAEERTIIKQLKGKGIIINNPNIIGSYVLSEKIRNKLIEQYNLNQKWGINNMSYKKIINI